MSPSTATATATSNTNASLLHVDRHDGGHQQTLDRLEPATTTRISIFKSHYRRGGGRPFLPMIVTTLALLVIVVVLSRQVHCLLQVQFNASGPNWRAAGQSELAFEYLHLDEIPSEQMCASLAASPTTSSTTATPLNSLSFAFNRIKSIESNAFTCVASKLRILNLRRNQIELISANAFEQLEQLQVLLLDGNRINQIPAGTFLPLVALRHLNLADNQIESIGSVTSTTSVRHANYSIDFNLNFPHPNELISLDLRSNPLGRLQSACLRRLTRLKTLILSKTSLLASGRQVMAARDGTPEEEYRPLAGLAELRFLHLDQLADGPPPRSGSELTSDSVGKLVPIDFCRDSPRLASLTLRNNQLTRIPKLSKCQSLLQIDLSHNQLAGSLNNQSFVGHPDLLDLYLGFNRLQYIEAEAFQGLARLQLLELNNNHLAGIHPAAFRPFSSSLVELNVAHNARLAELPIDGQLAARLRSLKANGNQQLRELTFKLGPQVEFLALTYAYHCCDYLDDSGSGGSGAGDMTSSAGEASPASVKSVIVRLLGSFLRKLLSPQQGNDPSNDDSINHSHNHNHNHNHSYNDQVDARNVTESVLVWPQQNEQQQQTDLNNHMLESNGMAPEAEEATQRRRRRRRQTSDLIDDFSVRVVRRIRRAHLSMGATREEVDALDYFTSLITFDADERPLSPPQPAGTARRPSSLFRRQAKQDQDDADKTTTRRKPICLPRPNSLQPCRDLFDSWWLRLSIWFVFIFSFTGNILVIVVLGSVRSSGSHSALTSIMWLQGHSKRHIDVPRFLVLNLAVADLLMSLYLGLLAFVDLSSLGHFRSVAVRWQHSKGCQAAGFLAVLSSELSVFILAIITLERNYAITNAVHLNRRLSLQKAMFIMLLGYLFALAMALMPLNGISDYRKFSICLPLDMGAAGGSSSSSSSSQVSAMDQQQQQANITGSQLYLITLVSINSFSFVLLFSCYLRMYCAIRGSQAWNTNDLRIAKRMSVLVVTDFLCWMPIIVVSAASLFDYHLVSLEGLKILTVFILPLNSVANPFLYAITTKKFKRDLGILKRRFVALLTSKWHRQQQHQQHLHQPHHLPLRKGQYTKGNVNVNEAVLLATNTNRKGDNNLLSENNQLMVSIRKAQKQQRQQQKLKSSANPNKTNKITCQMVSNFNQVTMNRTTTQCSCQMAAKAAAMVMADAPTSKQVRRPMSAAKSVQVRLDGSSSLITTTAQPQQPAFIAPLPADSSLASTSRSSTTSTNSSSSQQTIHPKIVLDIIEPALDVALAPLGLALTDQSNRMDELSLLVIGANKNCSGSHRPLLSSPTSRLSQQATSEPQRSRRQSFLCSHTELSAGVAAKHLNSCQTNNLSCQAILVHDSSAGSKLSDTITTTTHQDEQESTLRSASACGFVRSGQAEATLGQASKHRSDSSSGGHLSRSIQRLLFSPIAKTWSSIQSSLQSINSSSRQMDTVVALNGATLAAAAAADDHMKNLNGQSDHYKDDQQPQLEPSNSDCIDDSPETTLEDILQLSSPARRSLLHNNSQRRMSRSCELIPSEMSSSSAAAKRQSIISNSDATRSTSSQYDDQFDDDSRILLATINRMARSRRVAGKLVGHSKAAQQPPPPPSPPKSRRCYRCRSWSPALLDKLEDCMYQLKSRVSNLGASGTSNQTSLEPARQMPPHERIVGIQSTRSDLVDDEQEEEDDDDEGQEEEEEDNDDEDDEFNETGLPDWNNNYKRSSSAANNQCRREQFRRQSRGRHLRQQSSTNSDTLSTRTAATILTNLSVSFGSNTNIPPKPPPPPPPPPPLPPPSDQFQH